MKHSLARRWALPGALLCSAGSVLVASPANASHAPDHQADFYAAEVFAWEHGDPETTATCDAQTSIPGMADAADLPADSTAAVGVEGPLQSVTGDDSCRTWMIGGVPVAAPFSADPQLPPGSMVRAVGAAEVAPTTMIVAERIVDRKRTGAGAAEVELLYLAELTIVIGDVVSPSIGGQCATVPNDNWTVEDRAGVQFTLDVSAARAAGEIEPCTATGATVGVEFDLAPIEGEPAEPTGPVLFDPIAGIGMVVDDVLTTLTSPLPTNTGLDPAAGLLGTSVLPQLLPELLAPQGVVPGGALAEEEPAEEEPAEEEPAEEEPAEEEPAQEEPAQE